MTAKKKKREPLTLANVASRLKELEAGDGCITADIIWLTEWNRDRRAEIGTLQEGMRILTERIVALEAKSRLIVAWTPERAPWWRRFTKRSTDGVGGIT